MRETSMSDTEPPSNDGDCSVAADDLRAVAAYIGDAWSKRESSPLAADVCLLSALRKIRTLLNDSGKQVTSSTAQDALEFADLLWGQLSGVRW